MTKFAVQSSEKGMNFLLNGTEPTEHPHGRKWGFETKYSYPHENSENNVQKSTNQFHMPYSSKWEK